MSLKFSPALRAAKSDLVILVILIVVIIVVVLVVEEAIIPRLVWCMCKEKDAW